jgi:choice-of-anchor B domain-containing protein
MGRCRYFLLPVVLLSALFSNAQQAYRITKLANFNDTSLHKVDMTDIWNDCSGWYDPVKNREYAIAGTTDSIYFFDVTGDSMLQLVDREWGRSSYARNRDYEVFRHYVYCVSDQGSGVGALQVFDMQYLPDSVHKVYESSEFGYFTHTIFADTVSRRLYMCSNTTQHGISAMDILSIDTPEKPRFLATLETVEMSVFPNVHEMYVRNDTGYLSCGYAGLYFVDLRDLSAQHLIGSITTYSKNGYNHSSWLDRSGKFIAFTDEQPFGLDAKIFDISDMGNPRFVSFFNSHPTATPHNAYWVNDLIIASAYHDGVQVWNVRDPYQPIHAAWYDTHPVDPEQWNSYRGCWGVYPYLPSRRLIASDLTSGIFLLKVDTGVYAGIDQLKETRPTFDIFPNPVTSQLKISSHERIISCTVTDMQGRFVEISQPEPSSLDVGALASGLYMLRVETASGTGTKKFVKQ